MLDEPFLYTYSRELFASPPPLLAELLPLLPQPVTTEVSLPPFPPCADPLNQ